MIRLLIADDHAIVREGLKQLIALHKDIQVLAEAANSQEIKDLLCDDEGTSFDLLVLDMNMPGINGIEMIALVKKCRPALPILVYSMHNEIHLVISALKAGASGYFTKGSDPKVLVDAIRRVNNGGQYIDPELAERMVFESAFPPKELPHMSLSERELEIFLLLVAGKGINEIADQLFISNKTVSTHKANLTAKMNLHNVADMVRYAVQHKLTG